MAFSLRKRKLLVKRPIDGKWQEAISHFHKARLAIVTGTTSATAGTQTTHPHGLPITPVNTHVMILSKGAGVVYMSADPDETNIYVKGEVASEDFVAWILWEAK